MSGHLNKNRIAQPRLREWLVEYTVSDSIGNNHHHLTVVEAMDIKDVQVLLFQELRESYPAEHRIEVTILMLETVQKEAEIDLFLTRAEYRP